MNISENEVFIKNFLVKICRVLRGTSIEHLDHDLQGQIKVKSRSNRFFRWESSFDITVSERAANFTFNMPLTMTLTMTLTAKGIPILINYDLYCYSLRILFMLYFYICKGKKITHCNLCNLCKIYILISEEVEKFITMLFEKIKK